MIYNDFEEQSYQYQFSFGGWGYYTVQTIFGWQLGTAYYKKRKYGRQFRQITIKEYEDALKGVKK